MMSFPHFLNADPSVTAHLEGLHPDPEKHDFFIDIQPVSYNTDQYWYLKDFVANMVKEVLTVQWSKEKQTKNSV